MNRRTALALPLAALASTLTSAAGSENHDESPLPFAVPDLKKESHQMAIMLLLLTDVAGTHAKKDFFKPYNSSTYAATVFGKNGVDPQVFQAAQRAFADATTQAALSKALVAMRTQTKVMGITVQNDGTIYDPADPCPYYDAALASPTVKKLTV